MRLRQYVKVTQQVYNRLRFDTMYVPDLGKTIYISPLFCNSSWYFDIKYDSYIVVSGGVPLTNEISYIDIELIYKTSYCSNTTPITITTSPVYYSPLSDPDEPAREERKSEREPF